MPQEFKRAAPVERLVSEIKESDIRIRVLGTVIDKK